MNLAYYKREVLLIISGTVLGSLLLVKNVVIVHVGLVPKGLDHERAEGLVEGHPVFENNLVNHSQDSQLHNAWVTRRAVFDGHGTNLVYGLLEFGFKGVPLSGGGMVQAAAIDHDHNHPRLHFLLSPAYPLPNGRHLLILEGLLIEVSLKGLGDVHRSEFEQ